MTGRKKDDMKNIDINIKRMNIDDIAPADYNPRVSLDENDDEYQKIKRSIETFGYVDPIIWNERTGIIVGGHQRFTVLKDLGYKEVDVSVVNLDDEQEKLLNIALNKISGAWDENKLRDLLETLDPDTVSLSGFDDDEVDALLNEIDIDKYFEDEEKKHEENNDDDGESRMDIALELLELAHAELLDKVDGYKSSELHQSIVYFLGD